MPSCSWLFTNCSYCLQVPYFFHFRMVTSSIGSFGAWFLTTYLTYFATYGLGYFISIIISDIKEAMVLSSIIAIAWSATNGHALQIPVVSGYGPLQILWWLSYTWWCSEALFIIQLVDWKYMGNDRELVAAGYNPDNLAQDWYTMSQKHWPPPLIYNKQLFFPIIFFLSD